MRVATNPRLSATYASNQVPDRRNVADQPWAIHLRPNTRLRIAELVDRSSARAGDEISHLRECVAIANAARVPIEISVSIVAVA
ncbi:hypothetical protein [Nocardia sp. NPDC049526]|uniref:hypothetical protein n=1 Tax=Nocardia sp. NPDC049526 TaxID=3364316 RepID=UPI0037A2683B